mmetsp:Transcript_12908/g.42222  ORF Transcript_12908/g.42222 Transcript_12908/m.42222 type:complete len:215 (-) Transcript_12908:1696-2340(-)
MSTRPPRRLSTRSLRQSPFSSCHGCRQCWPKTARQRCSRPCARKRARRVARVRRARRVPVRRRKRAWGVGPAATMRRSMRATLTRRTRQLQLSGRRSERPTAYRPRRGGGRKSPRKPRPHRRRAAGRRARVREAGAPLRRRRKRCCGCWSSRRRQRRLARPLLSQHPRRPHRSRRPTLLEPVGRAAAGAAGCSPTPWAALRPPAACCGDLTRPR